MKSTLFSWIEVPDSKPLPKRELDDEVLIYPFLTGNESFAVVASSASIQVLKMPGDPAHGQVRVNWSVGVLTQEEWRRFRAAMDAAFEISDKLKSD